MERAIDKIRAAFVQARRQIHVKEWGLDIYIRRFTMGDIAAVRVLAPDNGDAQNVHLLCRVAEDADSKPLFQLGDFDHLMNGTDYLVVQRVISFMFASTYATLEAAVEDQRKQLDTDPPSASVTA